MGALRMTDIHGKEESDMAIQIGDVVPDFEADTTEGHIHFHEWIGDKWCVLMSHPKDFTPVCTTELGMVAKIKQEFEKRNCKAIAVSVDDVKSHKGWIGDIEETQSCKMNFPIIGDPERKASNLYGMIHPKANDTLTVRSVFFIDPNKKVGDDHLSGEHGAQLRRDPARPRLAPADRQVP